MRTALSLSLHLRFESEIPRPAPPREPYIIRPGGNRHFRWFHSPHRRFRKVRKEGDEVHAAVLQAGKPSIIDVPLVEHENHRVEVLVNLDIGNEDRQRICFKIVCWGNERTERVFECWIITDEERAAAVRSFVEAQK